MDMTLTLVRREISESIDSKARGCCNPAVCESLCDHYTNSPPLRLDSCRHLCCNKNHLSAHPELRLRNMHESPFRRRSPRRSKTKRALTALVYHAFHNGIFSTSLRVVSFDNALLVSLPCFLVMFPAWHRLRWIAQGGAGLQPVTLPRY